MNSIQTPRLTRILVLCSISAILLIDLQRHVAFAERPSDSGLNLKSNASNSNGSYPSTSTKNKRVSQKKVENVNINNEENTHVSVKEKNKFNSQLAQIVINMPKQKILRKSRRPTTEEKNLKDKIVKLFRHVIEHPEDVDAVNLMWIVIEALNPKYIATVRIWKILNSSAMNPYVPAEPLPNPIGSVERLELTGDKPFSGQLAELAAKLKDLVEWDSELMEKLSNTADKQLAPVELAMKRALLCANNQHFCPKVETLREKASKKLQSRGVLDAIGRNPLEKRNRPVMEKLIEDSLQERDKEPADVQYEPRSLLAQQSIEGEKERVEQVEAQSEEAPKRVKQTRKLKSTRSKSFNAHSKGKKHSNKAKTASNTDELSEKLDQVHEQATNDSSSEKSEKKEELPASVAILAKLTNSDAFRAKYAYSRQHDN